MVKKEKEIRKRLSEIQFTNFVEAKVFRDGKLRDYRYTQNWLANNSWDWIATALGSPGSQHSAIGYIAVGTGASAFSAASTALTSEYTRLSCTYSHVAGSQSFSEQTTFGQGTFATGGTSVGESATFSQSSGGSFFSAVTFNNLTLFSSDTLQITWVFGMSGS